MKTCQECKHWNKFSNSTGQCRRRSPVSDHSDASNGGTSAEWPVTANTDWCALFASNAPKVTAPVAVPAERGWDFARFRPFFPKPDEEPIGMHPLHRKIVTTIPISSKALFRCLNSWQEEGLIVSVSTDAASTPKYRIAPAKPGVPHTKETIAAVTRIMDEGLPEFAQPEDLS